MVGQIAAGLALLGCASAKLERPAEGDTLAAGDIVVTWRPIDQAMVVQYYQDERCLHACGSNEAGVRTPATLHIETPGQTEIKLWRPRDSKPADSIWINVVASAR